MTKSTAAALILFPSKVRSLLLFAGHNPAIVSAAIVPLHVPENSAVRNELGVPLLLIGSEEEKHFNSSLGTLFLDFIGEVLAVHLQTIFKPA